MSKSSKSSKNVKLSFPWGMAVAVSLGMIIPVHTLSAQTDSITLVAGRPIRGTVESYTPDNIVIQTSDGKKDVSPASVRLIRFDGSNDLVRAKSAYTDGRYAACKEGLENISDQPDREVLKQEIDFYLAAAAAQLALQGGKVSLDQAARDMDGFLKAHPNSFHYYPALGMFGDLAMAMGRFDAASNQYEKTAACEWPKLSMEGKLKLGKAKLYSGEYGPAIQAFQETEANNGAEDYAVQSKLIAQCLRAQALALQGKPEEGRALVSKIIENENSKNIELFAHANNALGVCFVEEGKTKEAIRAFLKTDLLFTLDPDCHAQALYQLVNLWAKNERPDRAARARQKLTERYRNTYWASKLK